VLILGPKYPAAPTIATHLQGMLGGDSAFKSPEVEGQVIDQPAEAGSIFQGRSLMYYFYGPNGRTTRLASLSSPWTYVVLLEQPDFADEYPEFYFEGVRVLGCAARAVGATPIVLMTWGQAYGWNDTAARGEIAYRVANGTRSVLSPAGYAWSAATADSGLYDDTKALFVAAATLYSSMTGRDASSTSYAPSGISASAAKQLTASALQSVTGEAGKTHYDAPFGGVVQVETRKHGGDFWFLDWGTSSERLWEGDMATILPKAGFTAQYQATDPSAPEGSPFCDTSCLSALTPYLQKQQFALMYARDYSIADAGTVSAATLQAIGPQQDMQVQIWDRHWNGTTEEGLAEMEYVSQASRYEAAQLDLAFTPYHVMFARLATVDPTIQLTSDGTHATAPVAYGQATMSIVSRTGITTGTKGLDSDTTLASQLADQTVRQLSSLSVSGLYVPDDPSSRPSLP
jgi:hypothetical protein